MPFFLILSNYSKPASKALSNRPVFTVIPQILKFPPYLPCSEWEKLFKLLRYVWRSIALALMRSWELWRHKQESLTSPSAGILLNVVKWRENVFNNADGESKKFSLPVLLTESKEIKFSKHIHFYIFTCLWVYITAIVYSCMWGVHLNIKGKNKASIIRQTCEI